MEKAILVIPHRMRDSSEALGLARTAGLQVEMVLRVRRKSPYYIGRGKLEELRAMLEDREERPIIVVFDDLKPREAYGISKALNTRVIDRIQLILKIFDLHAGSREAKLQIELARLRYELPLIKEYVHRSKLGELPGFLGPGRYAVEEYYRLVKRRMVRIKRELAALRERRARERRKRRRFKIPIISIAGYTNAGKTTLFNLLTGEEKPSGPEYFTTISPKSKRGRLGGREAIFVDTVGFIENVPAEVVEAFYATLEEIADSDLIILVIDASEDEAIIARKLSGGLETLRKLGVTGKPLVIAANKIDVLENGLERRLSLMSRVLSEKYWGPVKISAISAKEKANIDTLGDDVWSLLGVATARYMY